MPVVRLVPANLELHRLVLIELNVEYVQWVADGIERDFCLSPEELVGMPVRGYVERAVQKVCLTPPDGTFYLVELDAEPVGMGGIRRLRPSVGEIKRVYVAPRARGLKLGQTIMERLLHDARRLKFDSVLLDTAPFMTSAHRLYESLGFLDCPAYPEVEVPDAVHHRWRFMRLDLRSAPAT